MPNEASAAERLLPVARGRDDPSQPMAAALSDTRVVRAQALEFDVAAGDGDMAWDGIMAFLLDISKRVAKIMPALITKRRCRPRRLCMNLRNRQS